MSINHLRGRVMGRVVGGLILVGRFPGSRFLGRTAVGAKGLLWWDISTLTVSAALCFTGRENIRERRRLRVSRRRSRWAAATGEPGPREMVMARSRSRGRVESAAQVVMPTTLALNLLWGYSARRV